MSPNACFCRVDNGHFLVHGNQYMLTKPSWQASLQIRQWAGQSSPEGLPQVMKAGWVPLHTGCQSIPCTDIQLQIACVKIQLQHDNSLIWWWRNVCLGISEDIRLERNNLEPQPHDGLFGAQPGHQTRDLWDCNNTKARWPFHSAVHCIYLALYLSGWVRIGFDKSLHMYCICLNFVVFWMSGDCGLIWINVYVYSRCLAIDKFQNVVCLGSQWYYWTMYLLAAQHFPVAM